MESTAPEWLDKAFLTSCLNEDSSKPASVEIISYHVNRAVPVGNNYGSELYRVKIKYCPGGEVNRTEEHFSLILKGPVQNSIMEVMGEIFGITEFNFYYKYLLKVKELTRVQFAPMSYFSPLKSVIALEDLSTIGFTMADRHKQLDFDHCKQYFTISGKFHAVGIALGKKYPDLLETFPNMQEKMFKDEAKLKVLMHTLIIGLKCLVKTIEPLNLSEYKPYITSTKKYIKLISSEKYMSLMMDDMELQKNHFKSFIHGDCWTTNMMFEHNESGKPVDIRLVDFQNFSYDAVVSDVINFTWMSANNNVLENDLDELYSIYCDNLNSTLEELGCDERCSLDRLKTEIYQRVPTILILVGAFLPLTQSAEMINNSTMFSENLTEDQYIEYYQGEHFWEKYPKVLKFAANQGVFDWVDKKYSECGLSDSF